MPGPRARFDIHCHSTEWLRARETTRILKSLRKLNRVRHPLHCTYRGVFRRRWSVRLGGEQTMSLVDIVWLAFCSVTTAYVFYSLIHPERFD